VELHQRPQAARGALLQFECLSNLVKRAVPRPSGTVPEGYARGVWVSSTVPGRARGKHKAAAFHNPQALSDVQEEGHSCARGQVVIITARPPALTPPWRYQRSLVSKGRFAIFINQRGLCGNLFKPPEKAISRGDYRLCRRPPPPPRQGMMLVVSWIMTRVWIWENIELSVGFRGCCE
jgi:hypothetical protein